MSRCLIPCANSQAKKLVWAALQCQPVMSKEGISTYESSLTRWSGPPIDCPSLTMTQVKQCVTMNSHRVLPPRLLTANFGNAAIWLTLSIPASGTSGFLLAVMDLDFCLTVPIICLWFLGSLPAYLLRNLTRASLFVFEPHWRKLGYFPLRPPIHSTVLSLVLLWTFHKSHQLV